MFRATVKLTNITFRTMKYQSEKVRKASLNSSPFLMRQVIKRGQTNAYYYFLDFGPKFSKHWICILKSVKTERF